MIFNNIDMCDYFTANDVRRDILPPVAVATKAIPGRVGERFIKRNLGMGIIEVDITVEGFLLSEMREKVREIAGILNTDEEKQLIFSDEPDKYYMAILNGDTRLKEIVSVGEGMLTFLCPDPLAYSLDAVTASLANKVYNGGTAEATGVITVNVTDSVDYVQAKLKSTGEIVRIGDDFVAGDTVIINLAQEHAEKNGHSIMAKVALASDFFDLPTGEFEIEVTGGTGTLEFRERWL
ncbi:MAG TPA: distal tail protein Dit [Oscillospiraceae bacterium]|nr:distal tail protein Dit [Oscillospiraceae bacterium]